MPFHPGSHKPHEVRRFRFSLKRRLQIAAIGVCCILGGFYRYWNSVFIGENWLHQPVLSTDLIGLVVVVILPALPPSSWIEKIVQRIAS